MSDKDKKQLVQHLERTFPNLKMIQDAHLFNDEQDCSPEYEIDWYEFIETLKQTGYSINKIKS